MTIRHARQSQSSKLGNDYPMRKNTHIIERPNILRCLFSIFLPIIVFVTFYLISIIFKIDKEMYYGRVINSNFLQIKFILKMIIGLISLSAWAFFMLPISLKSLIKRNDFIIERNGRLCFLGKEICYISEIKDISLKKSFGKIELIVNLNGVKNSVGNIVMAENYRDIDVRLKNYFKVDHKH